MAVRSGRVDREGCPLVPRLGLSLWRAPHPGSTTRTSCCSAFPSHWGETGRTEGAGVLRYHPPLRRLTCHRAEGDPSSLTPAAALGRPLPPEAGLAQGQGAGSVSHAGCFPACSRGMQGCVYGLHLGSPVGLLEENPGQSGEPPETGLQGAFLSQVKP